MNTKDILKRGDRVTITLKGVVAGEHVTAGERVMVTRDAADRWKRDIIHVDWSDVTDVLPPVREAGDQAYVDRLGVVEIVLHDPTSASYVVRTIGDRLLIIPDDASVEDWPPVPVQAEASSFGLGNAMTLPEINAKLDKLDEEDAEFEKTAALEPTDPTASSLDQF